MQANLPGTTIGQVVTFVLYGDTNIANQTELTATSSDSLQCTGVTTQAANLSTLPNSGGTTVQAVQPNVTVKVGGKSLDGQWVLVDQGSAAGWLPANALQLGCDMNALPPIDETVPSVMPGLSAFYFSTGVAQGASCKDIPPGGMLIQNPTGYKVRFRANGVDITLASTVILRAQPNGNMTISVLEGHAIVSAGSQQQTVPAMQEVSIPLGSTNGLDASGPPSAPYPIQGARGADLDVPTICQIAQALGFQMPCSLTAPVVSTPAARTAAPTRRATVTYTPTRKATQPTFTPSYTSPAPTATGPTFVVTPRLCTFTVRAFGANPNPALYNPRTRLACSTLSWSVTGVEQAFINRARVPFSGSQQVCIKQTTNYTLTMTCGGRTQSRTTTLNFPLIR
jgi:hypothetical protein